MQGNCKYVMFCHIDGNYNPVDVLIKHILSPESFGMMKHSIFWTCRDVEVPSYGKIEGIVNSGSNFITETGIGTVVA
jgi:hypothetical protein